MCAVLKRLRLTASELIAVIWERSRDYMNSLPATDTVNTNDEPQGKQNA
jgi:hypothetical protein